MSQPTTAPKSNTVATGLAMFSMFFGAGNVVFPLAIGQYAKDTNFWAILGLLITAVGVPFLGLISMTLFNGSYQKFFERIGAVPGYIIATLILCVIGPFGAMPRCIALSYDTMKLYMPNLNLIYFSIASCIVIFLLTFRKNKLLDVLGYFLTPILLGSLALIIIVGLITGDTLPQTDLSAFTTFVHGLTEGYQTLDLLGAFFFSSVVISILEQGMSPDDRSNIKKMIIKTLKAGSIGISLLALSYIGFSYVAAYHSEHIHIEGQGEIIARLANYVLGPYGGLVACIAVAFACLTTAMALAVVFAEFLHYDLFNEKIGYITSLVITLVITFFVSTLNFTGIVAILGPILKVSYPALILLSALNLAYKLWGFKPVKTPVFVVFAVSLFAYLYWPTS